MTKTRLSILAILLTSILFAGCSLQQTQNSDETEIDTGTQSQNNPGTGAGIISTDDSLPTIESEVNNTVILDEDFSDL